MIESKLNKGAEWVSLDDNTPEDLVGCIYSLPIIDYVKCPKCKKVVPNMTEDEFKVTDIVEWDKEFGRTDEFGDYTGRKEFTCPNCKKYFVWDDDNFYDIVPRYTEVYDAVNEIYMASDEDDWGKAFDIYMRQKGGKKEMNESKKIDVGSKTSLEEATIKALYDGLKDDEEVEDVEGLVDDVLVVTDPEITTDEYNEVIDRAQEIIEDTPEGDIPLDTTYLGEYVQICPICGGTFVEDHILEPGTACPICYETPESFVMVGKLQAEEEVAEDNGLVDEEGESLDNEEEFTPTSLEKFGAEDNNEEVEEIDVSEEETPVTEPTRPRGARLRRNR